MSLFSLILNGCVGTVDQSLPPDALKLINPPTTFNFSGITTARPISHNKVELEFFPTSGGPEITYKLYVNNSLNAISIDPQALSQVPGGKYLYTVEGLQPDREYKFKISAVNTKTFAVSTKENEAYARTFDNVVSNFSGISKLTLVPGSTDSAITVDWIAPTMSGVFTAGPYDPVNYEVTVISQVGGSGNLNNPLYFGTDKRVIYVPTPPARATPLDNPRTVIVDGLSAGTTYYFQVRAINTLYRNYQEDANVVNIPVSREMNTKMLSIKTAAAGTLFDFRQDNVVLANATGVDAFDKIDIFWQPGSGSFTGYRVFVRKYDGIGDPTVDDKLTESTLNAMNLSGNYFAVNAASTSRRVSGLDNGGFYQVKVALCKDISCPVLSANANAAIISDLKSIRVQPTLAAFSGVNSIEPPGQFNESDVVNIRFDAPLVNSGFANNLEIYCVDPNDKTSMVKFDGNTPISGSSITRCNGLYMDGTFPAIGSYTSQKIKGLVTDGSREYCFAATPSITGFGADIRLAVANRIVRCSFPEVVPPSISQFSGLNNSCAVSATNANVTWSLPTGGIYSGFRVYWKEKSDANKFSFPNAIAPASTYFSSPDLAANVTSYTATNLMPGKTYQIGVLAIVDMVAPAVDLYSEYNLRIVDCVVPLPVATFKGFTRIFAVGPRLDGRVPNDTATKAPAASSAIYEAINADGIPFEVAMDSLTLPNISTNFTAPPGRDFGASFGGAFDGIGDTTFGYAMSNQGIVSLSWEDVGMSFPEAETLFANNQPAAPATRTNRTWGYKVYRSSDNKLTWKDLTLTNGPVYSTPYTYRHRSNVGAVTRNMAFFTDYSVKSLSETHDAANARDVDRARVYYYKIVPVFNGFALNYTNTNTSVVKITLPPPNMALVHRWMANRGRCLELDKIPDIASNYDCAYNGVASKPKSFPYRVGNTFLDQGGDLLVDRNELGCRYTRGDKVTAPEFGSSNFALNIASKRHPNDLNFYPMFKGYRTVAESEDPSTPFKGCTGSNLNSRGATGTGADYPGGFVAEYFRNLQGDCIGQHVEYIGTSTCTGAQFAANEYNKVYISTPGSTNSITIQEDCSAGTPTNPSDANSKYSGFYAPNFVMQSEFLAVFHNTSAPALNGTVSLSNVEGPNVGSLSSRRQLNDFMDSARLSGSQCSVNLASIDGSGYMRPRWISLNDLGSRRLLFKGQRTDLIDKTVDQLTEVTPSTTDPLAFYNGTEGDLTTADFKLPGTGLRSSPRYRGTTRIAKVMTSNSAKLPPLGRLHPEIAESVCSNYWVQTGIASDNGNFSPDSQPVRKRLLRRTESVTASAWPAHFDSTTIQNLETGNTTTGNCNNSTRGIAGSNLTKGGLIHNRTAFNNTLGSVPLLTGSSAYNRISSNTDANHTANCVSRYGIQDMVGNMSEQNSERIFCDYSQDAVFIGPVTATWAGGTGAENKGAGGPDINFFNTNDQRNNWAFIRNGTLANGTTESFELRFRDGVTSPRSDLRPWIQISPQSGYCSVVDSNPNKRSGLTDFFKDVATGYWSPLYQPGGALNTTIVERTQTDQTAVNTWRNGDGRFLDFGPLGMAPALNTTNTLAMYGGTAVSKYFNPVIGLPLICSSGSCNDQSLSSPNDNTAITTSNLAPLIGNNDDIPTITNFPTGTAQITNVGISTYQYAAAGYATIQVPTTGAGNTTNVTNYVAAITVDDPVTMGNPVLTTRSFPNDFQLGSDLEYYRVVWDVERGAEFSINSGGKSNISTTGRYTASIQKSDVSGSLINTDSSDLTVGARCAILINQDP